MKFLNKFNELNNTNLDFDTFKEIMFELSDDFNCDFADYSDDEDPFYDCVLKFPNISYDELTLSYDLYLPDYEDPQPISSILVNGILYDLGIYEQIDKNNNRLLEFKNKIDMNISMNNKIKKVFNIIEDILHRFKYFSNYKDCLIGWDEDILRISVEIK